tara:strand:- start:6828 stop:8054 length:1227 start_codon:yes stop_codon:yes gene_type:complete
MSTTTSGGGEGGGEGGGGEGGGGALCFGALLGEVHEIVMEAASGQNAQIDEGFLLRLSDKIAECHSAHTESVNAAAQLSERAQHSDSHKVSVKIFTSRQPHEGVQHRWAYSRAAAGILDPSMFRRWDLGEVSRNFIRTEPGQLVSDHPSEACELYDGQIFGVDPPTRTCLTAQPDFDEEDLSGWESDGRDDNYWSAPGSQSSGHAIVMGDVVPVDPDYPYTRTCSELYDELFGAESLRVMRVPDWYGEDGGTKGVETQPMSRMAFIVIGNGKPLLLGCQDSHAGAFYIIGRGVKAMLRFTEYDDQVPAGVEPNETEEDECEEDEGEEDDGEEGGGEEGGGEEDGGEEGENSVYKAASAYIFIAVPPGAPAPETYNETMRKMCSEEEFDVREEGYLNRLLLQMRACSEE